MPSHPHSSRSPGLLRLCLLTFLFLLGKTGAVLGQGISIKDSVLTQHNDIRRTGVFNNETILTPSAISGAGFTKLARLCIRKVDGQVAAQPLYVKSVRIDGKLKDVLYVVTRKNMVYAFDASNTDPNDPNHGWAWKNPIELTHTVANDPGVPGDNLLPVGAKLHAAPLPGMDDEFPPRSGHTPCQQTHGPVGITSTPVIDPVSELMYVVFRVGPAVGTQGYGTIGQHFIATIDIKTGQEMRRAPVPASFSELNRPGLLLMNNVVYVAFGGAVCDAGLGPFQGRVFAFSAPDLTLLDIYQAAPSAASPKDPPGNGAGIWQSGGGLAGDKNSNSVYATTGNNSDSDRIASGQTGNGADDLYHPSRVDLGESILKLTLGNNRRFVCDHLVSDPNPKNPAHCVTDHFTAGNWYRLDTGYKSPFDRKKGGQPTDGDSDLGSGGPAILSNGWVIGGGKEGRLYVLDPHSMKKAKQGFQFSFNTWHAVPGSPCNQPPIMVPNPASNLHCYVPVEDYDFAQSYGPNIHGTPVVWEGAGSGFGYIYTMAEKDYVRGYKVFSDGRVEEHWTISTEGYVPPIGFPRGFDAHTFLRSPDGMPGGALSLSANNNQGAILWVSVSPKDATNTIESGVLMAFDPRTLQLLWYDDDPDVYFAKFVPPTVAGGKVFRATFGDHDGTVFRGVLQHPCRNDEVSHGSQSCGSIIIYGTQTKANIKRTLPAPNPKLKVPPHSR